MAKGQLDRADGRRLWIERVSAFVLLAAAAQASAWLPAIDGYAHLIWLSAGVAVGLVLVWGARIWPAIFAYSLITDLVIVPAPGHPLGPLTAAALGAAALKAAAPVFGVRLMRAVIGTRPPFHSFNGYLGFVLCAVVGTSALVALGGAVNLMAWGRIPPSAFGTTLFGWFLGDAVSILFTAPLFTLVSAPWSNPLKKQDWLEFAGLIAFSVLGLAVFLGAVPGLKAFTGLPLFLIPAALWAAVRLPTSLMGIFAFLVMVAYGGALGLQPVQAGPFGFSLPIFDDPRLNNIVGLQIILSFTFFAAYLIGALLDEREAANEALQAVNRDLERRVEARTSELRRSEAHFRGITTTTGDAIVVLDHDGRVMFWNPAATRLFGWTAEEMTGQRALDRVAQESVRADALREFAQYRQIGRTAAAGQVRELLARHKEGYDIPVELTISPLREDNGYSSVVVVRDIRRRKEAQRLLRQEKERADNLLRNILPETVIVRINAGEGTIADRFPDASVLFCDLAGFTPMSSSLPADEIVRMLNIVFSEFDELVRLHGAEKIKTMGDGYMVAAGLPVARADHAEALVRLALEMHAVVARIGQEQNRPLVLRTGIHSGDVVAGVIGRDKFVFDIWGDTVNVASRMESTAPPGEIQISESTAERLTGCVPLEGPRIVDVRGKGPMRTWLVRAPGTT